MVNDTVEELKRKLAAAEADEKAKRDAEEKAKVRCNIVHCMRRQTSKQASTLSTLHTNAESASLNDCHS